MLPYIFCQAQSHKKAPLHYVAEKVTSPIVIDGQLDEQWEKAKWSEYFTDIEGDKKPIYETRMKMLWDDTYFYFFAEMEEPHIWGDITTRDAVIFYNNDFEIFIDPDGDTHNYMEFEMNALNTVWDLFLTKPYRNAPKVIDSWDIQGLKTAVEIKGTLNNNNDEDQGWTVEIAMPWSVLTEAAANGQVPANEFWRINFSRVNWDFDYLDGKYSRKKDENAEYLPEYNWVWSPQGVINMHEPEHWGYVYFATEEDQHFDIPQDEALKWKLYEIYRTYRKQLDQHKSITWQPIKVLGKEVRIFSDYHETGWNISVSSPFSGNKILIKEDGKLLTFNEKE